MQEKAVGSALLRRHIGRRLHALRVQAGMTQEQVAELLERSRSTIARIEDGDQRIRFRACDVKAMLDLYGATTEESEVILGLTAETRREQKSWWHDYTASALPPWFAVYVSMEDSAETIRQYEPELIPGLLQTRRYAEQVVSLLAGYLDGEEIQRRVNVRLERQSLLRRPRAPHLSVILSEAVLHRCTGDNAMMTDQLEHLVDMAQQATVSIRIVPWAAGMHGGMAASAFTMLDFPLNNISGQPLEPALIYVDTLTGAMYLNNPDDVSLYRLMWDNLAQRAMDEASSRAAIATALEGLHRAPQH